MDVNIFLHLILDSYNAPLYQKTDLLLCYMKRCISLFILDRCLTVWGRIWGDTWRMKRKLEDKKKTTVHIMVLKEKAYWQGDRQNLLNKEKNLQRKLSITEEKKVKKRKWKADLQQAEEIRHWGQNTKSLHQTHFSPELRFNTTMTSWRDMRRKHDGAEEEIQVMSRSSLFIRASTFTVERGGGKDASLSWWLERLQRAEGLRGEAAKWSKPA